MMNNDLLDKVFAVFGFTPEENQKLRQDLREIISANLITFLLSNLPEEKKRSLKEVISKKNPQEIERWINESKASFDPTLVKGVNSSIEKSLNDFFAALVEGLDAERKEKIKKIVAEYKND